MSTDRLVIDGVPIPPEVEGAGTFAVCAHVRAHLTVPDAPTLATFARAAVHDPKDPAREVEPARPAPSPSEWRARAEAALAEAELHVEQTAPARATAEKAAHAAREAAREAERTRPPRGTPPVAPPETPDPAPRGRSTPEEGTP